MSGQDALEELQDNIQEALGEELSANRRPRLDKAYTKTMSVRDIGELDVGTSENVSHSEVLESWQILAQSLFALRVFVQYTPALERFFVHTNSNNESNLEDIKTLLDLMNETVNNHDKDPSTECRYVTLLEILTSYENSWEVSGQVTRLWEVEGHQVETSISAEDFRQSAYSVLMSLAWVPNSHGLRQACSITEEDSLDDVEVPSAIQYVFDQILSDPLPRHDSVHRILQRLEDDDHATIAISSNVDESFRGSSRRCQGLGKTTLAAMVATQAQSQFDVLWLRLKHESDVMMYRNYTGYLDSLCEQLGVQGQDWPQPTRVLEERALQRTREEEKMFQVKQQMARLLRQTSSNLLLILDDVQDDQEIEWFRFLEDQSLLVTTQSRNLSVTWTLDLELLREEEALELFLTEADYAADDVLGNSFEVKSIIQRCGYHPLTIRMVARWFSLKEATVGVVKAAEELDQELSACTAKLRHSHSYKANPEYVLTEVMNYTLSPVLAAGGHPTTLMKMCFSSTALVFELPAPSEVVLLLWEQLLQTEPDAIHELGNGLSAGKLRKRARFIMEALTSLGLISICEKDGMSYIDIQHDTQLEYARSLARELYFEGIKNETEAAERWHKSFVKAYLTKKAGNERDGLEDDCRHYAIENLVTHMTWARMYKKATALMKDDSFLTDLFAAKGFEDGTDLLVRNCQRMQSEMEKDGDRVKDPFEAVASIYTKVTAVILAKAKSQDDTKVMEAGKAVHNLSFALAENGYSPEAILQYKSALKLVPKKSTVSCILLYGLSALNMLRNEQTKARKNLGECLKAMAHCNYNGPLYSEALLLKGDALMAQCDFEEAMELYDQSLEVLFANSTNNRVEIGIAICRKGMLHYVRGQLADAKRVLGDSVALKVKVGEKSASLAGAYYFLGHICAEQNLRQEAIDNFEKALRMMKENLDEVDNADIHLTTGNLCELRDDMDGCLDAFDYALKEIREFPRLEMDRAVHDLRSIARVYAAHGDYVGALPIFDEGLEITEDRPGSLERASLLFDMGNCESERGEYEDSAFHLKESLEIRKEKLEAGEVVIATMEKLGTVYKSMGKSEEALSLYNEALASTEITYGEDNEKVASMLFILGDLKESMEEDVEALANYEECLELRRRHLEITSIELAVTLEKIGSIYVKQGHFEKAYPCFAEALDIRQAISDPDDPFLAESFHRIGVVARKRGDYERSLHFLLDALHIRREHQQSRLVCETLFEIGHVHLQSTDRDSALGCYEKCLEILHENYGESDTMASDVLLALGHIHRSTGDSDKALECCEKALTLRTKSYSNDSLKLAMAHWSIGMAKLELDEYDEALRSLGDFVKIQDANNKTKNVDYIVALQVVGDIHHFFSDEDAASSAWSAASHVYSGSKDLVARYPELGPMLQQRLITSSEKEQAPVQESTLFQTLVSHLSDEVNKNKKMERDPTEREFQRALFLED